MSGLSGCRGGHPRNPRADVSRLTGRDDVAIDVALDLAYHCGVGELDLRKLLGPGSSLQLAHPYDAFPDSFGRSIDALKVRLWFLLHPVIEACLDGWRISPSQMASNSLRYMVAFLGECHGSGVGLPARVDYLTVPIEVAGERPTHGSDKRLDGGGSEPLRKKTKVIVSKPIAVRGRSRQRLEKMGQVTYEFGYRIALEHFRAKYPDSSVKEDPFDYGTPPED
ncbi:hypothetical protein BHE74_00044523 [Ensete ventricosum]|nr:hypothetical protein BHE74_00044523 [Ensete ventricosum]